MTAIMFAILLPYGDAKQSPSGEGLKVRQIRIEICDAAKIAAAIVRYMINASILLLRKMSTIGGNDDTKENAPSPVILENSRCDQSYSEHGTQVEPVFLLHTLTLQAVHIKSKVMATLEMRVVARVTRWLPCAG